MVQRIESKKPLYCVAVEIFNRESVLVKTSLEYIHADDTANAKYLFRQTAPNTHRFRIVAVAPVIGYHVDSSSGNKLSV